MPRNRILSIGGGSAFASGGVTANVIPKATGTAGQLQDSALTDNGTNVTSTEPVIVPESGTKAATAFRIGATDGVNTGFFRENANVWDLAFNGNAYFQFSAARFIIGQALTMQFSSGSVDTVASDLSIGRVGAASLRQGFVNNASPVAQTFTLGESSRGGTDTNVAGALGTIGPGIGTGTGAASAFLINRNIMGATGTTAQTRANAFGVGQSKTLSNTSATAQTIATITLGSNAGGGCSGTFTIVATDGTNFDAETQSFNVSFVNKATVVTVGAVVVTATTAAANSGTTSLGITAVANGNNIDIKVTPVFGTIVPTTVTLYPVISHSTNTVTFV